MNKDWLKEAEHLCQQWANAANESALESVTLEYYRATKQAALTHLRTFAQPIQPPLTAAQAAAPELLALLVEADRLYSNSYMLAQPGGNCGKWINNVRAAIAKATGVES